MANFKLGVPVKRPFSASMLTIDAKRQLCADVLEAMGIMDVQVRGFEMIHSCRLPLGGHSNGDRNPSAHLNFEKLTFNCWGCGGGGLLWFIATMLHLTDSQARDWLEHRTGATGQLTKDDILTFLDSLVFEQHHEERTLPHYDDRILDGWSFIHPYLTHIRHLPLDNLVTSKVGYGVFDIPMGGGNFVKSERITIPHFWRGQLVGWQSRRLFDDATPKYHASSGFPKDLTLYNNDPKSDRVVIVEAPISVVAHRDAVHMEATFGAMLTDLQHDLVAQHPGDIILWMDNDGAGWLATKKLCEFVSQRTSRLFVIDNPYAADPADLDRDTFLRLLSTSCVHWTMWQPPKALLEWRYPDEEVRNGEGDPG